MKSRIVVIVLVWLAGIVGTTGGLFAEPMSCGTNECAFADTCYTEGSCHPEAGRCVVDDDDDLAYEDEDCRIENRSLMAVARRHHRYQ